MTGGRKKSKEIYCKLYNALFFFCPLISLGIPLFFFLSYVSLPLTVSLLLLLLLLLPILLHAIFHHPLRFSFTIAVLLYLSPFSSYRSLPLTLILFFIAIPFSFTSLPSSFLLAGSVISTAVSQAGRNRQSLSCVGYRCGGLTSLTYCIM